MINIINGKFKGKKIEVPDTKVRPTSSMKKEAIFSILESHAVNNNFNLYEGKCFIDLFAGSGSLGIESISRGASFAYFYELNSNVLNILKKNCYKICAEDEYKIYNQNSTYVKKFKVNFPLSAIFIDPPYEYLSYRAVINNIVQNDVLNQNTIIIIEADKKNNFELSKKLKIIKEKVYGKTKLFFLKKL